jgi:hypothetical protein
VVNTLLEWLGFALIVSFLWFVWPPLTLLGAGLLLVLWANARAGRRSVRDAADAARRQLKSVA